MPLTREQFSALRAKGLSVEQIVKFEKGQHPAPAYSGSPDLPLQDPGILDPLNWAPAFFGGGATALGAKATAGAAGKALASGAGKHLVRQAGTGIGASVGAGLGGPGGAAVGGLLGRQVLSPQTIEKILELFARRAVQPSGPQSIAEPIISAVMRGGM